MRELIKRMTPGSHFRSFPEPIEALVVGANGGLGQAFTNALAGDDHVQKVHAWARSETTDINDQELKILPRTIDLLDEVALATAAQELEQPALVVVATGILHDSNNLMPEKSLQSLTPVQLAKSFQVNAILPALIAKHVAQRLPRRQRAVFCVLSARVGSVSDNHLGGWYSYRASKAALNQLIKCISIELGRSHPLAVCLGLHPGTVNTKLSAPFQKGLPQHHRLFTPAESVAHLLGVIDRARPEQSGSVLAWDGTTIPA